MASTYLIHKDIKKRNIYYKHEFSSKVLNCLYREHLMFTDSNSIDAFECPVFHYAHYLALKRIHHCTYRSKIRNRCLSTGSARAVIGRFKLSRFPFKMFARNGDLNGIRKSS